MTKAEAIGDSSGSCAIIVLVVDKEIYVANVGDSRAVLSAAHGQELISLSRDHRPNDDRESQRVEKNGGQVYQQIDGPHRILPGRLSVARTFGDL